MIQGQDKWGQARNRYARLRRARPFSNVALTSTPEACVPIASLTQLLLPVDAGAELHRPRAARRGDLPERRRSRTGIPDVKVRMVQEVECHQPQSHPQTLLDSDLLVNTHVQQIEIVVAEIDHPSELPRSRGRRIKRGIHLAGPVRAI